MKKSQRHEMILNIIENNEIDTQETLQEYLLKSGVEVTQATISRDIKELSLIKSLGADGYKYTRAAKAVKSARHSSFALTAIFKDTVSSIDYALNTVVVKCYVGMAQAVCAKIDDEDFSEIVGTIAGDDTIFILTRSEKDAANLVAELKQIAEK